MFTIVWETQFTAVLLVTNCCVVFHTNNCKTTFALPSIPQRKNLIIVCTTVNPKKQFGNSSNRKDIFDFYL